MTTEVDQGAATNRPELSVSELADTLRRTIETNFDYVRVRGELGRVTIARSGHMYADIKDDKSVLNTVMWKGQVNQLPFRPEEGLEVIAEGKLSIYAGRSNYQLLASSMRPAGVGALMALLDERKKTFAAEGLFDPAHKKKLPFLPRTIGVVTSPTGAVIRDILHRIADRFPVRVILWPALVQGDLAAAQVEAGIRGFNAMPDGERPDTLIVGRGGGSIEDLWPFNEEAVVRAAFESTIPLISAVGHETDTTLIDYVSDARAPTPTGAAEIAVPVRTELALQVTGFGQRLKQGLARRATRSRDRLRAARLPRAEALLDPKRQRVDFATAALPRATRALADRQRTRLDRVTRRLPDPASLLTLRRHRFGTAEQRLTQGLANATARKRLGFTQTAARLRPETARRDLNQGRQRLSQLTGRLSPTYLRQLEARQQALTAPARLLESLSHKATLKRGFVLARDETGGLLRSAGAARTASSLTLTFADGEVAAAPSDDGAVASGAAPSEDGQKPPAKRKRAPKRKSAAPRAKPTSKADQGSLF
ncbi:MAG: exodeoxyribonuclease VII large subunit [Pseudomonadota bacterium]